MTISIPFESHLTELCLEPFFGILSPKQASISISNVTAHCSKINLCQMKSQLLFTLFMLPLLAVAQESSHLRSFSTSANYAQFKEGLNLGLVFHGPGLQFDYNDERLRGNSIIDFQAQLGGGVSFRQGMLGFNAHLRPLRFFYGNRIFQKQNSAQFHFGPTFSADYSYQLYPHLHSGISLWFTHFSLSPELRAVYPLANGKNLRFRLSTSVIGLSSRPERELEPYFFSFKFGDIVRNLHHELAFGSLDRANQTTFSAEYLLPRKKRDVGFAFQIEYFGYYKTPKITFLNYVFQTRFYFKHKK